MASALLPPRGKFDTAKQQSESLMRRNLGILVVMALAFASIPFVMTPSQAQTDKPKEGELSEEEKEAQAAMAAVMSDKRLLSIHREFVNRAEKLALEYEKDKDWDKAKTV